MKTKRQLVNNCLKFVDKTKELEFTIRVLIIIASLFLEVLIDIRNLYAWHSGYMGIRTDDEQNKTDRIGVD